MKMSAADLSGGEIQLGGGLRPLSVFPVIQSKGTLLMSVVEDS